MTDSTNKKLDEITIIRNNWNRFVNVTNRGHDVYVARAKLCERMYQGGGKQWDDKDRAYLERLQRPVVERNRIFPAVNTAIGMQIKSRVDISYKPRGGSSDETTADLLSKIAMQICDDIHYQWLETAVFSDGIIEQRGFFDIRISFSDNLQGSIEAVELDPLDVIPDPDANSYDPKYWNDIVKLRWMTRDDIEELFGKDKGEEVEKYGETMSSASGFTSRDDRPSFSAVADNNIRYDFMDESGTVRYLVIDRQYKKLSLEKVVVSNSGDIYPVDMLTDQQFAKIMQDNGGIASKRMVRRIRWTVSTADILLHDSWSPYKTYTVIPFFPYFRRGQTIGMVDNAISPQQNLNKNSSSYQHIISSIANSGFFVEQNSLTNMETADLADYGSSTGLIIEYAKGSSKPEKIEASAPPVGIDKMITRDEMAINDTTGISDAMKGSPGAEISGIALETKNYQGQAQLTGPLDNLARTQYLVAMKFVELIQGFYSDNRIIMITDDAADEKRYVPLEINIEQEDGSIINDVTVGEYDVVVTSHPTTDTFRDNQLNQALAMKRNNVNIPDTAIVEMSNLSKKNGIIKQMRENSQTQAPDPESQVKIEERAANAALRHAQADKVKADTVNTSVDSQYSAIQTAKIITEDPASSPLADTLLRSANYQDHDGPPIIPTYGPGQEVSPAAQLAGLPPNTNPTTPVPAPGPGGSGIEPIRPQQPMSASTGIRQGIETPQTD